MYDRVNDDCNRMLRTVSEISVYHTSGIDCGRVEISTIGLSYRRCSLLESSCVSAQSNWHGIKTGHLLMLRLSDRALPLTDRRGEKTLPPWSLKMLNLRLQERNLCAKVGDFHILAAHRGLPFGN